METTKESADALKKILEDYYTPDPKIVGKLPKKSKRPDGSWGPPVYLPYVGHADITAILIRIDPFWSWEPVEWADGRPKIHVVNGMATMWGRLTILGKTVLGVGTATATKSDLDKELYGDCLRNCSMRLGVALGLWSRSEWDGTEDDERGEEDSKPATAPRKAQAAIGSAAAPQQPRAENALPDDAVLELKQKIDNLPEKVRVPLKYAFKEKFGTPDQVTIEELPDAMSLIDEFAAMAP
jgi:hypothetical protein